LYERLGGYDAFVAVAKALDPKLIADPKLELLDKEDYDKL